MGIKAVFFDLDGTLVNPDASPVQGVPQMIEAVEALGLKWVVASNHTQAYLERRLHDAGLQPDLAISKQTVGARKPSPEFCYYAAHQLGIHKNEMVYVGDDNLTDAICAINAGVLYLNAGWSNRKPTYGIITATPHDVVRLIRTFLLRTPVWYWNLDAVDNAGMRIDVRSVLPGGKTWNPVLGPATFDVLKRDVDSDFPVMVKFSRFLLLYVLTTIYLDHLHDEIDTWCMIPSSQGNERQLLAEFVKRSTKLFKEKFYGDLLVRHRASEKAAYSRAAGNDPGFLNQAQTLHLNPEHRKAVEGKTVLVIDDYCTRGHSFECARQLLYRGGAAKVVCVSVGRYGTRYTAQASGKRVQWDPWRPNHFQEGDFFPTVHYRPSDAGGLPSLIEGFDYLRNS